jgi:hypothetical protein
MQELRNPVPQKRARQRFTGACRPFAPLAEHPLGLGPAVVERKHPQQITPETNPLREAHRVSSQPVSFPYTKEKTHATRKTRHKTPGSA